MLQHKQPFASSNVVDSPSTVTDFAMEIYLVSIGLSGPFCARTYLPSMSAVSPNSFMITAIRYPCRSVSILFNSVDFPAPKKPQMIVNGTRRAMGLPSLSDGTFTSVETRSLSRMYMRLEVERCATKKQPTVSHQRRNP